MSAINVPVQHRGYGQWPNVAPWQIDRWTHRLDSALQAEGGAMPSSIAGLMAGLIASLGLIALVVVVLRL